MLLISRRSNLVERKQALDGLGDIIFLHET